MKYQQIRLVIAAFAAWTLIAAQSHAMTVDFASIPEANKVGSGSNKSGLLIDFNDGAGTERHVFQYNWDGASGTVSGAEMITEVAAAIPLLSFVSGGTIADSFFISELAFDSQSQENGDFVSSFDYWGYFIAGGDANGTSVVGAAETLPTVVSSSPVGAGESGFGSPGRFIENNSWDVWSFGPFTSTYVVPELSSYGLFLGMSTIGLVVRRRKHSLS